MNEQKIVIINNHPLELRSETVMIL